MICSLAVSVNLALPKTVRLKGESATLWLTQRCARALLKLLSDVTQSPKCLYAATTATAHPLSTRRGTGSEPKIRDRIFLESLPTGRIIASVSPSLC